MYRPKPIPARVNALVYNFNANLVILAATLDEGAVQFSEYPIIGFEASAPTGSDFLVCDWPATLVDLTGQAWCIHDRLSGGCISPAEADWCDSLPVAEAREKLRIQAEKSAPDRSR